MRLMKGVTWRRLRRKPGFDYYINSVSGSDSNSGRSPGAAWATLGKLVSASALRNGVKIGLARGSTWREYLDASAYSNGTIGAYGSGTLPVIDASDVVSSFSKTVGYTNVYETTWTPTAASSQCPMVFVDGAFLTRVASLATCDSTPGACYFSNTYSNGVSAPFYIHSTGSTVPGSDGKVYHKTVRYSGFSCGAGWTVRNIRFKRSLHKDGAFLGAASMLIEDCIFEDGNVHNMLWSSGTMRRCSAWKADNTIAVISTGGIMFTHYTSLSSVGSVLYEDCDAIMPNSVKATGQGGFYGHGQSGTPFSSVEYRRCRVAYCNTAFDGTQGTSYTIRDSLAYECGIGHIIANSVTTKLIDGFEYYRATAGGYSYNVFNRFPTAVIDNITIRNSIINTFDDGLYHYYGGTGNLIENNIFYKRDSSNNKNAMVLAGTGSGSAIAATIRNNVCQGWALASNLYHIYSTKTGSTLTNSDNVYSTYGGNAAYGKFGLNGSTYADATLWLAAVQPGNETGSSEESANQFSGDPAARVYTLAGGSQSATKGIGPQGWTQLSFDYSAIQTALAAA